ncbi:MAG: 2-oxo acid dehydrogenase subunit E2 [Desulfatitalea sp.]|nr:2-oxo acid dehydrogenase subunit E2 [Desulfatitalea sp.]
MPQAFKLPDLGEGVHEGEVLAVHVQPGQQVREGDVILTVETDKAAVEIPSPFTGTVAEIRVRPGDIVKVGDVLITFDTGATSEKPAQKDGTAAAEAMDTGAANVPADDEERRSRGPVPASPATRRLARELGVDLYKVTPGGPQGLVTAEDVRAFAASRDEERTPPPAATTPPPARPSAPAAPVPETPPSGERIPAARAVQAESTASAPALPDFSRWGAVQRVPVRSIRRATARQMTLSWSHIPHVSSHDHANVTRLDQFRRKHKQAIADQGGRLTLTVFALKAAATALKRFPNFNASLDTAAGEIVRKQYFHIGVAVDTDEGLVVPVIRDVDRKSIRELAVELNELVDRSRRRKVSREEMIGGSFTITNAGAMGGGQFTPLINYPEVAIMGLGQARMQPVVQTDDNGQHQVIPQLMLPLVVCIDHRVLDGRDAVGFLKVVVEVLEDPDELLISMV